MIETIMSSMPVKIVGLIIILVSFIYILQNPDKKLMDVIKPKNLMEELSKEMKDTKVEEDKNSIGKY